MPGHERLRDSLERTFTIRANDAIISLLTASLAARVQATAPGVMLRFAPEGDEDLVPLRDGLVDIDLGVIPDLGPEVRTQPLYQEHFVGLVAAGHRLASGRVTLRRLAAAGHVAVSPRGRPRGALDDVLAEHGLTRGVVAVVPTFTAAAHIIVSSDLTGLIPARYARQVAARTGAHWYEIPAALPTLMISQAWHVRHDLDPAPPLAPHPDPRRLQRRIRRASRLLVTSPLRAWHRLRLRNSWVRRSPWTTRSTRLGHRRPSRRSRAQSGVRRRRCPTPDKA